MKRQSHIDEFFDRQPPLGFVSELAKPLHEVPPAYFSRSTPREGEVSVRGLYLDCRFHDPEGLLETATADFLRFSESCGICGKSYPIRLEYDNSPCFEAYTVEVSEDGCTVTAADTEGIRRALIYLEGEMTAREGAFLPLGHVERRPWLRRRITRGFFSPTNRPPKNGDELLDEIDYYPEEYLNRLAHDGTNGLWIYTSFSALVTTDAIPERARPGQAERIAKLNRVITRCARYGIAVYVFAIEPEGFQTELRDLYPDCVGDIADYDTNRRHTLCPYHPRIKAYCYEAGYRLFTACPGLAGIIGITAGERPTVCSSLPTPNCASPCHRPRCEILAENLRNLAAGMQAAKPSAELVSWTYEHRNWSDPDVLDYVRRAPENVIQMQNFEDRGFAPQLGKERQAMDYWLSYSGPSGLFEMAASEAHSLGKPHWAKMQICCSHELATLPYIPSPAHVYEKMCGARRLGITGVMECWYFGNYPSIMSRAAGELAFTDPLDGSDRAAFLHRLAALTYGEGRADAVTRAWEHIARGYSQYPLNIMFSYYSPAHDGVVWELALKPKNLAPPRSWLLLDRPDGDRICDALLTSHTLDEVLTLYGEMEREYRAAAKILEGLADPNDPAISDLLSVSEALFILCESTKNILLFYRLRDRLGAGEGEPSILLSELREIVLREIALSHRMIPLCEADGRLGYHSEAEGYKFFPEKLRSRIAALENLLETEFPEVAARVAQRLSPLEYYDGNEPDCRMHAQIDGSPEQIGESRSHFRINDAGEQLCFELASDCETLTLVPEFRLFSVTPPIRIRFRESGKHILEAAAWSEHWPYYGEKATTELAKWSLVSLPSEDGLLRARLSISKRDAGLRGRAPFKLRIFCKNGEWEKDPSPISTLGKPLHAPGCFGWVHFGSST